MDPTSNLGPPLPADFAAVVTVIVAALAGLVVVPGLAGAAVVPGLTGLAVVPGLTGLAVVVVSGFSEGSQQPLAPQHTFPAGQYPPVVGQHTEFRG